MPSTLHSSMRPRPETKTGRVWIIADDITRKSGRRASRSEVMEAFAKEGGNPNTASTQYSHWRAAFDQRTVAKRHEVPESLAGANRMTLTIGPDGRLLIPLELRARMAIGADGRVSASVENGELRVVAPSVAVKRLQQLVQELDQGAGSVVDELISDRRAELQ